MTNPILAHTTLARPELTKALFDNIFDYCPDTGSIRWKQREKSEFSSIYGWRMFHGKYAGREAGTIFRSNGLSYRRVKFNGKSIFAHRVAWIMTHGADAEVIDHINRDGLDNRIENLRNTSASGNMKNRSVPCCNKSGIMGVQWFKNNSKWGVIIVSEGGREFLGLHSDFFDACCTRKSAELRLGFHANHGRAQG